MADTAAQPVAIDIVDAGANRKKITLRVVAAKVDEIVDAVTREFTQRAALPGFRPGRAPASIILRKYHDEIFREAEKRLTELSYKSFHDESKLNLIGQIKLVPELSARAEKGKDFVYAFESDIQPEITLPDPAAIELEQEELTLFDEELADRLTMACKRAGEHKNLTEGVIEAGDQLLVDFRVLVDGQEVDKTEGDWWEIHGDHLHGRFVGQPKAADVVGKSVATPFTYPAKLADDFKVEAARGKDATVEVTVKSAFRTVPAAADDELAKRFGMESIDKLKTAIRESLLNEVEENIHAATLEKMVDALIAKTEFPVPEDTLKRMRLVFLREFLQRYRLTPEALSQPGNEKIAEVAQKVAGQQAERSIRSELIIGGFSEKYKIEVTPEEFNTEVELQAQREGGDVKKFMKKLDSTDLSQIEHTLRSRKTLEYLLSLCQVKIVPRKKPDPEAHHHHHDDADEHEHGDEGHEHAGEGHEHHEHHAQHAAGEHERPHVDHDAAKADQPAPVDHGHKDHEHGHRGHQPG